MFEIYGIPILLFAAMGLAAGILLTVAGKIFAVKTDPRIEQIDELLPHANCGACGFAGCGDYANAIVTKNAATNLCKPAGSETAAEIAGIMCVAPLGIAPEIAVLHCRGNCSAAVQKYDYQGFASCAAAKRLFGGSKGCIYGCIGLGDCATVCEYGAIRIVDGIADIQPGLCRACGKCASVCPNGLISLRSTAKHFDVRCASQDTGKITKSVCAVGCIGCRLCEKKCLHHAIHIENNHAVIDYDQCQSCGICCDVCPTGAICNCEHTN